MVSSSNNQSIAGLPLSSGQSDHAINGKSEDILGTSGFAKSLAKSLIGMAHQESIVVALYGPWGQGKTSVKNMALEYMRNLGDETRPLILEFNPWLLTSVESLHLSFFDDLAKTLKNTSMEGERPQSSEDRKLAAEGLEDWATILKSAATIAVPVIKIMNQGTGELVSGLLKSGELVASRASKVVNQQTIHEGKKKASEALAKIDRKVIVVLDDLDRLSSEELVLVFQLVKAHGDLPNVRYLLLFDRPAIEQALDKRYGTGKGCDYLEKIIQVGVEMPEIELARVHKYIQQRLSSILEPFGLDAQLHENRWEKLFELGISSYLTTLRRANKYLNSVAFYLGVFMDESNKSLEINVLDLLGLECLRCFEPNVYRSLFRFKRVLAASQLEIAFYLKRDSMGSTEKNTPLVQFDELIALNASNSSRCMNLLEKLFQPYAKQRGRKAEKINDDQIGKELRIFDPRHFRKYFHFRAPMDDISQSEITALIEKVDYSLLVTDLVRISEDHNRYKAALDYLMDRIEEISAKNSQILLAAIMQASECFKDPCGAVIPDEFDKSLTLIRSLSYIGAANHADLAKDRFLTALEMAKSALFLPCYLLAHSEFFVSNNKKSIQKFLTVRIKESAKIGELINRPQLAFLLKFWKQNDENDCAIWIAELLSTSEGTAKLFNSAVFKQLSSTQYYEMPMIELSELEVLATEEDLMRNFDSSTIDSNAVIVLNKALELKHQGKEYDISSILLNLTMDNIHSDLNDSGDDD